MKRQWLITLGLATWLVGCGGEVPTTIACLPTGTGTAVVPAPKATPKASAKPVAKKPAAVASAKPGAAPTAKPAPTASASATAPDPVAAEPDAMDLLKEVQTTTLGHTSLKGSISTYEMKADKSKTNAGKFNLLNQGTTYKLDCTSHTRPNNVGSKTLLVFGEPNAKVKPAGFLSIVTVTLALTDSNLISLNNITLDKILTHGVLDRVTNGEYEAELAGTTTINGDKITMVKVQKTSGANPLFADADYEYVGFDENKLYRMWALYAKPELALPQNNLLFQTTVNEATPGGTIPADQLKL